MLLRPDGISAGYTTSAGNSPERDQPNGVPIGVAGRRARKL